MREEFIGRTADHKCVRVTFTVEDLPRIKTKYSDRGYIMSHCLSRNNGQEFIGVFMCKIKQKPERKVNAKV